MFLLLWKKTGMAVNNGKKFSPPTPIEQLADSLKDLSLLRLCI